MNDHQDWLDHDEGPQPHDLNSRFDFHDGLTECPNCKKPITPEMDSCPYCGDILYRYLRNGIFAPKRGPLVKLVAVIIILLVFLATLGMILSMILP
ncbi:MAG: hypothetical protein IID32_11240 [Planctomycetes bacterium]|nr:hypothetical protein [Planctomycetota bacterium]